jgi:tRNA pseudouridine55 synthase
MGDAEGDIVEEKAILAFTHDDLEQVVARFVGEQDQVLPMFSALKHQGQPLYKLARQGIEIERKARRITIYGIELKAFTEDSFTLSVKCSKGTYIRTLVEDISVALGTVGYVSMLRRTDAAGYSLDNAIALDDLKAEQEKGLQHLDGYLHSAESALHNWPEIHLDELGSEAMRFGRSVVVSDVYQSANVRLFNNDTQFIGLGEMTEDGLVKPKRLFSHYVSS